MVLSLFHCGCQKPTPEVSLTPATPVPTATGPVALPPEIEPSLERGQLRAYYNKKYTSKERAAVREVVEELFPKFTPAEKTQAIAEILAFSYVVFHQTEHHHLSRNHQALRKHETTLVDLAKRYQVPPLAVTAIVSWENSGGTTKVSGADAAGLGQMTDGAIQTAHDYAHQEASRLRQEAVDPASVEEIAKHLESIEIRHQRMAKKAKMPDERFVPEANLEDVVLFFRFLLSQYGGRVDHAIGCYHKGVGNTDDLLFDYLTRKVGEINYPTSDRSDFLTALERENVTYLTLWNDTRSRQMLNGLRTMDGEVTDEGNRSQALGDESDIYPWKVLGSLAAYRQGPDYLKEQEERYSGPQSEVEVAGLPLYDKQSSISAALKAGNLVLSQAPLQDLGYRSDNGSAITPELEGYLESLVARWRRTARQNELNLPVKTLLNTAALRRESYGLFSKVQLRGITALIAPQELSGHAAHALKKVLEVDFLNDRIYRSTLDNGDILICLNPRFGHQFLAAYDKHRASH
jgi:hypothetical protein